MSNASEKLFSLHSKEDKTFHMGAAAASNKCQLNELHRCDWTKRATKNGVENKRSKKARAARD